MNENFSKVSIIIPVYNAEKYVEFTINSILNQTYKNIEIILIDDGSTDSSLKILKKFEKYDQRIKIIEKQNTGVSDSRNEGLKTATGEYVSFVDADDKLDNSFVEKMINIAKNKNADIVACGYSLMDKNGKIRKININYNEFEICKNKGASDFFALMSVGIGISSWGKLIKRQLLENFKIRYEKTATYDEDMFFSWKSVISAKKVSICKDELYLYRLTLNNSTMKYHPHLLDTYKIQVNNLIAFSKKYELYSMQLENEIDILLSKKINVLTLMIIRSKKFLNQKLAEIQDVFDYDRINNGLFLREKNGETGLEDFLNKKLLKILFKSYILDILNKIKRIIK